MARPAPRPFRIAVPDADLADLAARLRATRWPDELQGVGWEYGLPLDLAKRLAAHWADGFDWRAAEARLNAWPQFLVDVGTPPPCHEPVTLHCVHLTHAAAVEARGGTVEAGAPPATPLLLLHGWPGAARERGRGAAREAGGTVGATGWLPGVGSRVSRRPAPPFHRLHHPPLQVRSLNSRK